MMIYTFQVVGKGVKKKLAGNRLYSPSALCKGNTG
jgi:hypothetical protein